MKLVKKFRIVYETSLTKQVLSFLFSNNYSFNFIDTFFGNFFSKISVQKVGAILFYFATLLLWYRGYLDQILPFFDNHLLVPLSLVLCIIFLDKTRLVIKKIHLWYLLFLLIAAISGLMAVFYGLQFEMIVLGWLIYFQFGLVFVIGQILGEGFLNYAKKIIIIGIPLIIYSVYQYIARVETPAVWLNVAEGIITRSFGFFGSPNILGGVLFIIIILSIFSYKKSRNLFFISVFLVSLFSLYATFSRMAWTAFLISFLLMLFINYRRFFYISFLLVPLIFIIDNIRNRVFIIFTLNYIHDATLDGRIWSGINAFYLFSKNILLGTGPGTYGGQIALSYASPIYLQGIQEGYTALNYTDNQLFQVMVQTGLLGTITLIFFFISLIFLFVSQLKGRKDNAIMGLMIIAGFLWMGLFSNIMEFGAIVIPSIALLGVLSEEK